MEAARLSPPSIDLTEALQQLHSANSPGEASVSPLSPPSSPRPRISRRMGLCFSRPRHHHHVVLMCFRLNERSVTSPPPPRHRHMHHTVSVHPAPRGPTFGPGPGYGHGPPRTVVVTQGGGPGMGRRRRRW
ncbi:hypothetical protein OF846_003963 [Rhodotorula toruloides]|nr:hypothetical protein OF846_003963 [Rhodotorula toruloides]